MEGLRVPGGISVEGSVSMLPQRIGKFLRSATDNTVAPVGHYSKTGESRPYGPSDL